MPKINGDYILKTTLERPQFQKKYFTMDYASSKFEKIPDYRYQLLWEPNITELTENKTFEFYTSDITGTFKISIEGFSKNGEPILLENYFSVK